MKKLVVILMAVIACSTQETFGQDEVKIPVNQKIAAFFERYEDNDKLSYIFSADNQQISYLLTTKRKQGSSIKELEKGLIKELEDILKREDYVITSKISTLDEKKIVTYSKNYSEKEEVSIIYRNGSYLTIRYYIRK